MREVPHIQASAFTNLRLLLVIALSAVAQAALHQLPMTQAFFGIRALPPRLWLVALAVGLCPVSAIEMGKLFRRVR